MDGDGGDGDGDGGGAAATATAAEDFRRAAWKMGPSVALSTDAPTIPPDDIPIGLPLGRQPKIRVLVKEGTVAADSVRVVSKRLIFFSLATPTAVWECLAKWRDGCLSEGEIAQLAATLASEPSTLLASMHCFPEYAEDGSVASLHVIQAALPPPQPGAPPVHIPLAPREPEPEPEAGAAAKPSTRPPTHKNARHQQFVSWLIDTYGLEYLRSGCGVLDVAGGAGGVAFELAFRRGIPCVVVDPRPMKLNARQRRALQNRVNSTAVLAAKPPNKNASWWLEAGAPSAEAPPSQPPPPPPPPEGADGSSAGDSAALATSMVCSEALDDGAAERGADSAHVPQVPASYAVAWAEEGLPTRYLPRQICGYFGEEFTTDPRTRALWQECSVVVGMHPDEATEPIVQAARATGKPFAVVPCCVFAKANPKRCLPDGRHVETHEDFCEYLEGLGGGNAAAAATAMSGPTQQQQQQEPEQQEREAGGPPPSPATHRSIVLGFEGRNVVVHSVPPQSLHLS